MLVNNNDARPKSRSPNCVKNWYPGRITVPANLVFRLEIWDARDNGILPRSTPDLISLAKLGGGASISRVQSALKVNMMHQYA